MASDSVRVCKRNHPQTDENVMVAADGRRRCRPCDVMRRHRRYERNKRPCPDCGEQMAAESARCQACRPQPLEARFLSYVEKTDECWLWTAGCDPKGYGRFLLRKGRGERAHRVAYTLWVGPIPEGHELHHTCETPNCVRPDHLRPILPSDHARFHRLKQEAARR